MTTPASIVVMGVSGSGKTTIGDGLARRLGLVFQDADDLHPPENRAKMARGEPLDDADRGPWLDAVAAVLADGGVVMACSALKRAYRDRLRRAAPALRLVFLHGDRDLLAERMSHRHGHFMPTSLLDSQLATLEEPAPDEQAVRLDVVEPVDALLDEAARALSGPDQGSAR